AAQEKGSLRRSNPRRLARSSKVRRAQPLYLARPPRATVPETGTHGFSEIDTRLAPGPERAVCMGRPVATRMLGFMMSGTKARQAAMTLVGLAALLGACTRTTSSTGAPDETTHGAATNTGAGDQAASGDGSSA